ncbi:MAG: sulfurtransferase [Pseudonocardiales bacterium]|nr:sulfurtransferase [Pseudonocardiales bacterium]MBV9031110.1 sulfurtransferase [Pseudonocardiales bacterium]
MVPPVVDIAWWRDRRDDVLLVDVRWYLDGRSGLDAYHQGHLPRAVFVDLELCLSGDGSPGQGRHPLPDPGVFAQDMARLGIADDSTVLAYDDVGGVIAARLVWMLRATGHDAALLDGGLSVYDGSLERVSPSFPPAVFTPRPWPRERLADIDDAADPANTVLDARSRERYRGEHDPVDPRSGHIPGARSLPCRENLDTDGRFLPVAQLHRRFHAVGVTDGASVVSYCGSGVTACHNLLALELVGLGHGRLYPGSWSQYSHAGERPVETGDPRVG